MSAIVRGSLHGEIIAPGQGITLVLVLHPLKLDRRLLTAPAGLTVAELVEFASAVCETRLRSRLVVRIDGELVFREIWHRVRPKPGTTVLIRAVAEFGDGNSLLRGLLSIAVIGLAIFAAPVIAPILGLSASLVGGAITIGGQLLINALFPVASPQLASSANSASQTYSLSGGQNQATPFGVLPSILGKNRQYPPLGAKSYTEFVGADQYLRMLFVWGYGPLDISDIKIGETLLSAYQDVEVETRQGYPTDDPLTLFPSEVLQTDISVDLTAAAGWQQQTTDTAIDEISLDFVAPSGIVRVDSSGTSQNYTVSIRAEYSPTGTGAWTLLGTLDLTSKSTDAIRQTLRLAVANGQYDVQVKKTSTDYTGSDQVQEDVVWTAIRGLRNKPPIAFSKPLALTAVRIRATSQLNGVIDNLNAITQSIVTAFNGTDWVPNTISRNPADLFRYVLQGPANARPAPDSRVDLETLELWWQDCHDQSFNFDMVRDFSASVYDTLTDIAAAGRAAVLFRDGKWSVAWDQADAPIVQHFTPRNSWGFSGQRTYGQLPHAFRVQFVNATIGYQQDERIVYDDGYDATNATLFEQIEFPGVTDPDIIWRMGRFHIAQARLRPEVYSLSVDVEHIVCTRGDRVRVAHDVPMWGLASGRVKAVSGLTVTLDEPLTMESGSSYSIRFRLENGDSLLKTLVTDDGTQTVVVVTAGADQMPSPGDLWMAGILNTESVVLRVRSITPDQDLSAKVTFVDDAPEISSADSGTIPAFSSQITVPPVLFTAKPVNLRVDEGYQGTGDNSVTGAFFTWETLAGQTPTGFEAQFADADGDGLWKPAGVTVAPVEQVFVTGYQAGSWSFRVRAQFANGTWSDWATLMAQTLTGGTVIPRQVAPGSIDVFALSQELQNIKGLVTGDLYQQIAQLQSDLGDHAESVAGTLAQHQDQITGLSVANAGAVAYIETVESVAVTATNAVAQLQTDIGTTFGTIGASGGFKFDIESDAMTGLATLSFYVRATNGNFTPEAALQLGASVAGMTEDSYINMMADRLNFITTANGFVTSPFFTAVDAVTLTPYAAIAELRFNHQLSIDGTSVEVEGRNGGGFTPFIKVRSP